MNNTFNFSRFTLLVRRQWLDFGKIYLMSLLVITGVIAITYIFNFPEQAEHTEKGLSAAPVIYFQLFFRVPLFLILGFIFISITASNYFSILGQKPKTIIELMIPASTFEKWLCAVFYTGVLSIISFLLIFYLADLAFIKYGESIGAQSPKLFFTEFFERDITPYLIAVPVMVTSVFLLGSVYFNRFHYIKTAVITLIFLYVIGYLTFRAGQWLSEGRTMKAVVVFGDDPKQSAFILTLLSTMAITAYLWLITFFRLKEKEV